MSGDSKNTAARNLLLVFLFIAVTLFTAYNEGYLPLISPLFWLFMTAGFLISAWLALSVSTIRLLSLMLGIFIIEYIKETIGVRGGFWVYHGTNGFYNFGVWAWVLGGLTVYALSTKVVITQMRKLETPMPRWINPFVLAAVFLLLPLTLGEYGSGAGVLFWLFYSLLFISGAYASLKMDFYVFAGIVITSWVIGFPSEYVGSAASDVWTFPHNPDYPPFFLVAGCWPLEILVQYFLSALLAGEPLNQ